MEDQEVHLRELQEEFSNLKSLLDHPGWKWLVQIADEQIANRKNQAFGELENLLEVTKQQYAAGIIGGIELFKLIPAMTIEDLDEKIDYLTKELENGPSTESRNSDDERIGKLDNGEFGEFKPPV